MNAPTTDPSSVPCTILETIFDAAADAAHWSRALAQIAEWVGAVGATYLLLDADASMPRVSAIYSSGFVARADVARSEAACPTVARNPPRKRTSPSPACGSRDPSGATCVSHDAFLREAMNRLGIRWVAGSRLWNIERDRACLAIQKSADDDGFTDTERSRLTALTPHLGKAARLNRKLSSLALKAEMGIEATNKLSCGIATVDERRCVLYSNAMADRLLRQRSIFKPLSPTRFALCHAASEEAFRAAVSAARRLTSTALQLRDHDSKPVISAVVMPLPPSSEWSLPWHRPAALLTMNELGSSQPIPPHWLSQLFGLTRAESQVATWLVSGRTLDEYAEQRGVSLETARSQLKAVLSKAGMSRQAQLVATLAKLPIQQAGSG